MVVNIIWHHYVSSVCITIAAIVLFIQGVLERHKTIEGRIRYGHFGYAMANLGDINGDGFDGKTDGNIVCEHLVAP